MEQEQFDLAGYVEKQLREIVDRSCREAGYDTTLSHMSEGQVAGLVNEGIRRFIDWLPMFGGLSDMVTKSRNEYQQKIQALEADNPVLLTPPAGNPPTGSESE